MEDAGGDGEVAPRGELPPSILVWNHPREDLEGGMEVGAGEAPPRQRWRQGRRMALTN